MNKCKKCGKCCEIIRIYLNKPLTKSEEEVFIYKGGIKRGTYIEFKSPCCHLVKGICNIYEDRPQTCRDYYCEGM